MERKLNTRITEMLGIERPILSGAMQWLAKAELVAAVSTAGGLGVMSSATFPNAEELRAEIRKCRELTDKPFAVNLTLMPSLAPPDYPAYVKVGIEEGVRIMETSGRAPEPFMPYFKSAGMTVIHKCTIVKHALKAQAIGCDAVIMDGTEAAGHVGENDIGSIVLCPAAVTRFFLSEEAPALRAGKEMVAGLADEMSTTLVLRRFTNTTRVLNNGLAVKVAELEHSGAPFEEIAPLASGRRLKKAFETGNLEDGVLTIGQVNGILHYILPVQEIMDRMMDECFACLDRYAQKP